MLSFRFIYLVQPQFGHYVNILVQILRIPMFQEIVFAVYPDRPAAVEAHLEAGEAQTAGQKQI